MRNPDVEMIVWRKSALDKKLFWRKKCKCWSCLTEILVFQLSVAVLACSVHLLYSDVIDSGDSVVSLP